MTHKMRPLSFGVACGITLGLIACVVAAVGIAMGQESTLLKFFVSLLGFDLNMKGAFVALYTGAIQGFIAGSVIGYVYNMIVGLQEKT